MLQEAGQFTVLSYNIAGLPAIISSGNPAVNTPEIGRRISNFDIVNVQEDFAYHKKLYANDNHTYRTVTSGNVPFGSGLNTLSALPFAKTSTIQRVKWHKCSNFDAFDCLARKGFSMIQVQLAEGVTVDVYNVHADAGYTKADHAARADNINQVVDYILTHSNDQAVLVFGDTNALYTDAEDNIRELITRPNLTDAWVSYIRQGSLPAAGSSRLTCELDKTTNDCEVIDKIFFRGSNLLKLELVEYNVQTTAFADTSGKQLSDHVPISSTFKWSLNPNLRQSPAVGGSGGSAFTDINTVPIGETATSVTVRGGLRVGAVSITVGRVAFRHGRVSQVPDRHQAGSASRIRRSSTNKPLTRWGQLDAVSRTLSKADFRPPMLDIAHVDRSLALHASEFLQSIEMHTGEYNGRTQIFYVKFTTNTGRSVSTGTTTDTRVIHTAPAGFQIAGFHGRSGVEIDALGVVYTRL